MEHAMKEDGVLWNAAVLLINVLSWWSSSKGTFSSNAVDFILLSKQLNKKW